jgi:hypothetical protein
VASLRNRLGGAQILSCRLAATAVGDDVERHFLSLVEGAHARAFDRADMNKNILAAAFRLNEAEALLLLNHFTIPVFIEIFLSLQMCTWNVAREFRGQVPVRRFWRSV